MPALLTPEVVPVRRRRESRAFALVPSRIYARDGNWIPPLPGEEQDAFDPAQTPVLASIKWQRWVLLDQGTPAGRIAAFTSATHPEDGYFGFFECLDRPAHASALLGAAEAWLAAQGCRRCFGPIQVTPRDRLGLLIEGFERPAMLFTPYNPPYYAALLADAGYEPAIRLSAYGWAPESADPGRIGEVAFRAATGSSIRLRPLRLGALRAETRLMARLINATLAEAWHFDPISEQEADAMARQLRPILDPAIALVAEDQAGPCGVALAMPDVNWLWARAGGRLLPLGWARMLRWYRHIPQARMMALGLLPRVHGTSLAIRMIAELHRAGLARGYRRGELSQVFDENRGMRRLLERMRLPIVRRYAIHARDL